MSRSVPGSRSAVVIAAVVCSTNRWHTPDFADLASSWSSTRSVMSSTSRFLRVFKTKRCMALRSPGGRYRMGGFVSGNFTLVLHRQPNVVQAFEQTMPREIINHESHIHALLVANSARFKIYGQLVILGFARPPSDLRSLLFLQNHCQHAVLHAIVGKDVRERWRNHRPKTIIGQRPH